MKIKNVPRNDEWLQKSATDAYAQGIVRFAERWANLMEPELEAGKTIQEIAKTTSRAANVSDITEIQFAVAVYYLIEVWEYGEHLNQWLDNAAPQRY